MIGQYSQKSVISDQDHIKMKGFLLIVAMMFSFYLLLKLKQFKMPIKRMLKDASILGYFLIIIISFNYYAPKKIKDFLNYRGILYFVDLDKLAMMMIIFGLCWTALGFLFSYIWKYQSQIFEEYEFTDKDELHTIYENFYLYQDHNLIRVQEKIQYHINRQLFIYKQGSLYLKPEVLRNDFNYGLYLSKNSEKIYQSLLRINSFTALVSFLPLAFPFLRLWVPIVITILLFLLMLIQRRNYYQLFPQITNPYQFKFISTIERHPFVEQIKPPYISYSIKSGTSKYDQVIWFGNLNIRILHAIVYLQTFWFAWLFYQPRVKIPILQYTFIAIVIAIAAINITILIPKIVNIITFTHNIQDIYKIILIQQCQVAHTFEKAVHQLKSKGFQRDRQSHQEEDSDMYFLTDLQNIYKKTIEAKIKQLVEEKRQELIEHPEMISFKKSPLKPPADALEEDADQLVFDEVKSITQDLKDYEEKIRIQLEDINEQTLLNMNIIQLISDSLGGNLPFWYVNIMMQNFFNVKSFLQDIRYDTFMNYIAYNQGLYRNGQMFEYNGDIMTIEQFDEMLELPQEEKDKILNEFTRISQNIDLYSLETFISDIIIHFPQ
ncbi:hypothetical protein pb186bvf_010773 [Paramecium bursaria]